jgi:hypothetical protein
MREEPRRHWSPAAPKRPWVTPVVEQITPTEALLRFFANVEVTAEKRGAGAPNPDGRRKP